MSLYGDCFSPERFAGLHAVYKKNMSFGGLNMSSPVLNAGLDCRNRFNNPEVIPLIFGA